MFDEDAFVERLIEQLLDVVGRTFVGGLAVGHEIERVSESVLDFGDAVSEDSPTSGDVGELAGDAVLFGFQRAERDGVDIVGLNQFEALTFEFFGFTLELPGFDNGVFFGGEELIMNERDDVFA